MSDSEYGLTGIADQAVIDAHIRSAPRNATMLNLGCGPNLTRALDYLAAAVTRLKFNSTLIFADIDISPLANHIFTARPRDFRIVEMNAADAVATLGAESTDLIFAFGVFGVLTGIAVPPRTRNSAVARQRTVLSQCRQLLRETGVMLISNSSKRQPERRFRRLVRECDFTVAFRQESRCGCMSDPTELRYLFAVRPHVAA